MQTDYFALIFAKSRISWRGAAIFNAIAEYQTKLQSLEIIDAEMEPATLAAFCNYLQSEACVLDSINIKISKLSAVDWNRIILALRNNYTVTKLERNADALSRERAAALAIIE